MRGVAILLPEAVVLHANDELEVAANVRAGAVRRLLRERQAVLERHLAARHHDLVPRRRGIRTGHVVPDVVAVDSRHATLLR